MQDRFNINPPPMVWLSLFCQCPPPPEAVTLLSICSMES